MKKLKSTKKLRHDVEYIHKLLEKAMSQVSKMNDYNSIINKEYAKNINKLLEQIAEGENLDIKMLKEKYLKSSSTLNIDTTDTQNDETLNKTSNEISNETSNETSNEQESEENTLENDKTQVTQVTEEQDTETESIYFDKIIINGLNYYYENKEEGKIYDELSNIVGVYKEKKFIISKK
jgi:hypothetical protein